jgi:hypothetical protein
MTLLVAGLLILSAMTVPSVFALVTGDGNEKLPLFDRVAGIMAAAILSWALLIGLIYLGWTYFGGLLGSLCWIALTCAMTALGVYRHTPVE